MKTSKVNEHDTAHWINSNISNKFDEVPEKFTAETVMRAEMPPDASDIPDASILHKIIVRENLISEIKRLIQHHNDIDAARSEVSELVKAVRFESLDIVEDISMWKRNQGFSRDFLYRGENYLMKMYSDLDFLDDYDEFNFGFPVSSNPFVFPYNGGKQLPDSIRFTSNVLDKDSGFVTRKTRMEEEILVDGIEVSRLQFCDDIIRREVDNKLQKLKHGKKQSSQMKNPHDNHLSANSYSVLAVGENGMNDSYISAVPRAASSVSFRHLNETKEGVSAVSYNGNHLHPLNLSLSEHMTSSPTQRLDGQPSFDSYHDNPPVPPTEDSMRSGYSVSSKKSRKKPPNKTKCVTIETKASPSQPSQRSAPNKKWVAKTNQIKQMKDRIDVLTEEIGVVKAMYAHVADQVDFKIAEHQRLTQVRDRLESKRKQAVYQDRSTKAQDYAIKVNIADAELQQIHFTVKDLQRQRFFFEQEVKRKRQTVKRLQKDIEDVTKQTILQKKLEKRAKSEGLLAVILSRNRGESLEGDEHNDSELIKEEENPVVLSDDESVITEATGGNRDGHAESVDMKNFQLSDSILDEVPIVYCGAIESTFSVDVENENSSKKQPSEVVIAEELIERGGNITYLDERQGSVGVPCSSFPVPNVDGEELKYIPVASGSGYTFAKQSSWKVKDRQLLKDNDISTEDKADADLMIEVSTMKDTPVVGGNGTDNEELLKEQTCVVNDDVLLVKICSHKDNGSTTLRAYNDSGEIILTYQLIPALASQLKELSDEETNTFLIDMLKSTLIIPGGPTNMGIEYGSEVCKKNDFEDKNETEEDAISPQSNIYKISIKDVTYSSRLEFKEDGLVEIHASNEESGKNQVIPLLPVLAKQIKSLTYDQIKGVITDIIKAFTTQG